MYTKMPLFVLNSEVAKAVATKVGAQFGMEMAFGGAGEVFGTAWVLAQNRDEIVDKTAQAKQQVKNEMQNKKLDSKHNNPHRFYKHFDPSA